MNDVLESFETFIAKITKSDTKFPFNKDMHGWDRIVNDILCTLFKFRDISKEENGEQSLYLRRFYLWARGKKETGYRGALFLHNIRRSDNDRHMHDHPWDFTSYIVSGGYDEELPEGRWRELRRGNLVRNFAEHLHKVHLNENDGCRPMRTWTLVKVGPARRTWGFMTEDGWVDWKTYLGIDDQKEPSFGEDVIPKS